MRLTTPEPHAQFTCKLRAPILREGLPDHDRLATRNQFDVVTRRCARLDPHPAWIEFELRALLRASPLDYQPVRKQPDAFVIHSMTCVNCKSDTDRHQLNAGER